MVGLCIAQCIAVKAHHTMLVIADADNEYTKTELANETCPQQPSVEQLTRNRTGCAACEQAMIRLVPNMRA